ncbi:MAG TPA: ABC transporter ATP-binding protein [Acidimicrobiales bacterium]|nr:ABC transporter ATP-binding protein [Acidimicrobiales bacterium]
MRIASVLFVTHQVGELLVPVLAGITIDRAIVHGDGASLGRWLLLIALVFATLSTSWRWADRTISTAMEGVGHDLRLELAARAVDHRGIADRPPAGQVVSIASSDVDAVMQYPEALFLRAGSMAALTSVAVVVLWVSPPLGFLILLGLPPVLWLLQVLTKPIEGRLSVQQEHVGRAAAVATDLLRGLRPLKGLHAERVASQRYRAASRRSLDAGLHATRLIAAQQGLATVITGVFVAVIALLAGRQAADGTITIGQLIAAVGATQFLVGPLGWVAMAATMGAAARASATRVANLLDAPAAVVAGDAPTPADAPASADAPAVELRTVEHASLRGLDLAVAPGSLVAVAASDGPDAEALIDLLGRWRDAEHGTVALHGVDVTTLPIDAVRRQVLVSEHDAALFDGTVRAAITGPAGDGAAGPPIDPVLVASGVDEMVEALADGLDTAIADRGLALSGGQRQRLVLARALAADPPVLVLHEPTTAVDAVTEDRIAHGLREQRRGRTTVVVTSSPALLAVADVVAHVEGGTVTATGRHEDLLASSPSYRALVAR